MPRVVTTPSVKSCIKRLTNLTVTDLNTLNIRELERIKKELPVVLQHVNMQINVRAFKAPSGRPQQAQKEDSCV